MDHFWAIFCNDVESSWKDDSSTEEANVSQRTVVAFVPFLHRAIVFLVVVATLPQRIQKEKDLPSLVQDLRLNLVDHSPYLP